MLFRFVKLTFEFHTVQSVRFYKISPSSITSNMKCTKFKFLFNVNHMFTLLNNMFQVLREESFNHSCLFAVQLSRSDLMMFIAGTKGAVLSVRYPMPRPPEYSEFFLHNYPITKVLVEVLD